MRTTGESWKDLKECQMDFDDLFNHIMPRVLKILLLLLLLSRFSRVRLCAIAHQTLPSLGFSRQELWSGLPFPSPKILHRG